MNRDSFTNLQSKRASTLLIDFLQGELAVSESAIAMAVNHWTPETDPLHMILWQYGLVSLEQLSQIFDWLNNQAQLASNDLLETV